MGHGQSRRTPELDIQRGLRERCGPGGGGVIAVVHGHGEPAGGQPALAQAAAQVLRQPPQQRVQDTEIVGVAGQGAGRAELGPHFGREHRTGVHAEHLLAEGRSAAAEDGAEVGLADGRHLTDALEMVLVEPVTDVVRQGGEDRELLGGQEAGFAPIRDGNERLGQGQPPHPGGGFAHQLVGRHPHGERQAHPLPRLPGNPRGHVHRRAKEPPGAAQVQEGVAVAVRLDDGRIDAQHLVQRPGGTGIETRVGRQQLQVGAALARLPHGHAALDACRARLGRQCQDRGPVGPRRRDRHRPAPERRCDQRLDGGAEGGRVDVEDGAHGWK